MPTSAAPRATSARELPRPLLKWAGGKTQMLDAIHAEAPRQFERYIEPFVGGGAVFFSMAPHDAVLADSNLELISLYRTVSTSPEAVFAELLGMRNEEAFFYEVRAWDFQQLEPALAAARTIFLNRTCFNGLYRVNRQGQFNVPFGRYKRLSLPSLEQLQVASETLQSATIVHGDYKDVLKSYARSGDFVFLDPPYVPVGKYADFKRYTKEQFHESDHRDLATEVRRLVALGAHVVLTNSNHPLVHELYGEFRLQVMQTRRFINSKANGRTGEDVIVTAYPAQVVA